MTEEPEYSTLGLRDLLDIERHIDRELVPERWARLQEAISQRRREGEAPNAQKPLSTGCFVVLHVCFAPIVVVFLLMFLGRSGGESAEGWGQVAVMVMPCAVVLSLLSFVSHRWYAAAGAGRWFRAAVSVVGLPIAGAVLGFFGLLFLAWLIRMTWVLR